MRPANPALRWYLTSTAFYLVPGGIQMVLFPWLVAVYLHESPERLGLAQMSSQLPMLLLILWGGLLGDRVDQRTLLVRLQVGMMLPPVVMAMVIASGSIAYETLILWALANGCFGAFTQPARDALLAALKKAGPGAKPQIAWALVVLELSGERIAAWNSFLAVETLFPRFGLALTLA